MENVFIAVLCLINIIILTIKFFHTKRINSSETKIYSFLLVSMLAESISGIILFLVMSSNQIVINIFNGLYLSMMSSMVMLFSLYMIRISEPNDERYNLIKKALIFLSVITIICAFILPRTISLSDKNEYYATGPAILSVYMFSGICIFSVIFYLIKNIKKIFDKRYLPVLVLLLSTLSLTIVQKILPGLFLVTPIHSYIIFIMYFTIENPDVKMAKELAYQKEVADLSRNKTLELINDMSDSLKSSINKLESFGNKKIDKNNIDELSKEIIDFQNEASVLSEKILGILDLAVIKGDDKLREYKYETYDMMDKLKELLIIEQKNNETKLEINVNNEMPSVLYGDEKNVIKIVLYFYNLISSITKDKKMPLKIDSLQVGRFSRLRFNFITKNEAIFDYVYKNDDTKELEFRKEDDINFHVIEKLLKRFNGKITVTKEEQDIVILLSINQRIQTEYEIISNNEENKDINIKYQDFSDKRILIVDNNDYKVKELKLLLSPYKVEVYVADNPETVRHIISENATFDLVIIDDIISNYELDKFTNELIKPKSDLFKYVKDAKYPISVVILVTPNTKDMEQKYLDYGFNDYITKPINKDKLDKILVKYLTK